MRSLDALTQPYDVRTQPEVWLTRAETILARSNRAVAANLANAAQRALISYDAPDSPQIQHVLLLKERRK